MSKIGKKKINISKNIEIEERGNIIFFKGPLGCMNFKKKRELDLLVKENEIKIKVKKETKNIKKIWGLSRSIIHNILKGITLGYKKKLEIIGVGYKTKIEKKFLFIKMGYSHDIVYEVPNNIKIKSENNIIEIESCDKQLLGQVCSDIKNIRKLNIYKGKGIKNLGEKIELKQGKKK